jgi:hypothetical protein
MVLGSKTVPLKEPCCSSLVFGILSHRGGGWDRGIWVRRRDTRVYWKRCGHRARQGRAIKSLGAPDEKYLYISDVYYTCQASTVAL